MAKHIKVKTLDDWLKHLLSDATIMSNRKEVLFIKQMNDQLRLQSSTSMDGSCRTGHRPWWADTNTDKHADKLLLINICVHVPHMYLLAFHDLISGLENWRILHLDAFGHFHHFVQQLRAVPDRNRRRVLWSVGPSQTHTQRGHIWRHRAVETEIAANLLL